MEGKNKQRPNRGSKAWLYPGRPFSPRIVFKVGGKEKSENSDCRGLFLVGREAMDLQNAPVQGMKWREGAGHVSLTHSQAPHQRVGSTGQAGAPEDGILLKVHTGQRGGIGSGQRGHPLCILASPSHCLQASGSTSVKGDGDARYSQGCYERGDR